MGHEKFRSLTKSYFRCADGVMIFYDITNKKSFDNLNGWLRDVNNLASLNVSKLIIGNKCDLEGTRAVNFDSAKKYADDQNIPIMEVSAKECLGVEEPFIKLASEIMKTREPSPDNGTVTIGM
ncbi:hypothetical protein ACTFIZ_002178 [Dictyostelium cf. discoideum]